MNKKDLMLKFIRIIQRKKLLTEFIKNIFGYEELYDHNYLFRLQSDVDKIIIDIYDNVSKNRFNRYYFIFNDGLSNIKVIDDDNVFVTYIYIYDLDNVDNNLFKLGYLFNLNEYNMLEYAETFLDGKFVVILHDILNKFIYQS